MLEKMVEMHRFFFIKILFCVWLTSLNKHRKKWSKSNNFKTKLGFNQHDQIMSQEQSILSKIVTLFGDEKKYCNTMF